MDMDSAKFNIRLIKLENEMLRFEYDIGLGTNNPARLKIMVKRCEVDEEGAKSETLVESSSFLCSNICSASEFSSIPGMSYTFSIALMNPDVCSDEVFKSWQQTIARSPQGYEYLPKKLLAALMFKACNFYHGNIESDNRGPKTVRYFQRAQRADYWETVKANGVMETSIRTDKNGHSTRLNYSYGGTFFFAITYELESSAFGKKMLSLEPSQVLGDYPISNYSFYFADVKCLGDNGKFTMKEGNRWPLHYITIAVVRKHTEEENYCNAHLIELSPVANPFFVIEQCGNFFEFKVFNQIQVWIELFFMERLVLDRCLIQPQPVGKWDSTKVTTVDCPVCSMQSLGFPGNLGSDYAQIIRPIAKPNGSSDK